MATVPETYRRRVALVGEAARLERRRLLAWVLAWGRLSAAWFPQDGDEERAGVDLAVAALAVADVDA